MGCRSCARCSCFIFEVIRFRDTTHLFHSGLLGPSTFHHLQTLKQSSGFVENQPGGCVCPVSNDLYGQLHRQHLGVCRTAETDYLHFISSTSLPPRALFWRFLGQGLVRLIVPGWGDVSWSYCTGKLLSSKDGLHDMHSVRSMIPGKSQSQCSSKNCTYIFLIDISSFKIHT